MRRIDSHIIGTETKTKTGSGNMTGMENMCGSENISFNFFDYNNAILQLLIFSILFNILNLSILIFRKMIYLFLTVSYDLIMSDEIIHKYQKIIAILH